MDGEYRWKPSASIAVDAAIVGQVIEGIVAVRGSLQPADLVAAAEPADSPLHDAFTWDDAKAAELRRLDEARKLIRSLTVRIIRENPEAEPMDVRAIVHVVTGDEGPRYVPVIYAMRDADLRAEVIERAIEEAATWARRYREYEELAGLVSAVDAFVKAVKGPTSLLKQ
jgi:hypothetical protein